MILARYLSHSRGNSALSERALFLLAVVTPADVREATLGDVEERFRIDVKRFGLRRAKALFYRDLVSNCIVFVGRTPRVLVLMALRLAWKWSSN
jgi:hypothetical protein